MRTFVAFIAVLASTAAVASAQPSGQRCSSETFPVGGTRVSVTVCAPSEGRTVQVTETLRAPGKEPVNHTASLDVLDSAGTSRAVDDVSLTPLGLPFTMHLTLAYRGGTVSIEHALLLPGAVPLK